MKDFIFVSPQLYLSSQKDWRSDRAKAGYIPILKNDLQHFQSSLKHIVDARNHVSGTAPNSSNEAVMKNFDPSSASNKLKDNTTGSNEAANKSDVSASHYQVLKQFLPISVDQQIHTVSLQGVSSSFSRAQIESVLGNCLNLALVDIQSNSPLKIEAWSSFSSFLDTQDIFMRFNKVDDDEAFVKTLKYWEGLFAFAKKLHEEFKIELHLDSNTQEYMKARAKTVPEVKPENAESLYNIFQDIEGHTDESNSKSEQSDDSSTQYKVDTNTLSDLPHDTLDQLCKDIIEFRTKVVSIEKEKKMKSTYEENRRQRHQMQKVFDQIKKNTSGAKDDANIDEDDANMEDDDEDDTEDDLAVERRREERELEESNRRYEELLRHLHNDVEPKIKSTRADIIAAASYEEHLEKNRSLYLKELLHLANDIHYDHHRSFKEQEERRDKEDRTKNGNALEQPSEQASTGKPPSAENTGAPVLPDDTLKTGNIDAHKNVSEGPEHVKIKFEFRKAIDNSAESSSDGEDADEGAAEDLLPFTAEELDARLAKLKESRCVDELVREFLGVYESELVDYILENIRTHQSKRALVHELRETFDEDGETIAARLWSRGEFQRGT